MRQLDRTTLKASHVLQLPGCILLVAATLLALSSIAATGTAQIPDASFEVAVRQRENGNLSQGFHIFQLVCWSQQCSVSSISFDRCAALGSSKPTSMVKVERWSTAEGNLQVTPIPGALQAKIGQMDIGGESTITLRFGYSAKKSDILLSKLMSFSGGFVKNSELLKRVITVEYVPFVGAYSEVDVGCPLLVPGVEKK